MDFSKVTEAVMKVVITVLAITGAGAQAQEIVKPVLENLPTYSTQEYEAEDMFAEAVNTVMDRIEDFFELKEKADEGKEHAEAANPSPESAYNGDPPDPNPDRDIAKVNDLNDNDDEGNDPDDDDTGEDDTYEDLGEDPRDTELASHLDELNKKLDEKEERTEHREQFQENYNQDSVNEMKESNPEQYERITAANRMATREEIDAANGGETCWDSMSTDEMFDMLKTNPDRAKALLQDYQDRHPGAKEEGEPGFDREMMHENQMASKEERDKNDGIPQDMLDSNDPFKEFVSTEETEGNRVW